MKNVPSFIKNAQKLLDDNSPVVLTGMALVGLAGSVFLTYKATQKGTQTITTETLRRNNTSTDESLYLTNQEKFLLTYKFYAPAAIAVVGTGACMVVATKIGLNRTAALAGALVVAERGNDQYKDKVKELLGDKQHTKVTDAVANDQIAEIPSGYLPLPREGEQTFLDGWSMRPISSTMETVKKAVNDANREILEYSYISLTDFYELLGLDATQESGSIGWSTKHPLDVDFTTTLKDDRAVVVITFKKAPTPSFRDGEI